MFAQLLAVTLRLLIFRAGPEDLPYEKGGRIVGLCLACALFANTLLASAMLPLPAALVSTLLNLGLMALFTRAVLAARKLDNRFQQTFNALLMSNALFALAMFPFWMQVVPVMMKFGEQVMQNPELRNQPEQWPKIPAAVEFSLLGLFAWQIAVTGYIFFKAAGGPALTALILIASLMLMLVMSMQMIGA